MGALSPLHLLVILVVVLLLFGNRLPSVMRSLGKGMTEFKKGMESGGEDEEEEDTPQLRDETRSKKGKSRKTTEEEKNYEQVD